MLIADEPFVIAGGGIAGLAAALGLAREGRTVTVLEQAPAFEEVGAGLQLGPNAIKALKYLRSWDSIATSTFAPERIVIRDGLSGGVLKTIPLDGFANHFGEAYRVIHRADLLAGLLASARASQAISLHCGKRLIRFSGTPEAVVTETEHGEIFRGKALIAADGARSVLAQLLLGDVQLHFAGQILFRALIPLSGAPAGLDRDAVELWLCPGAHVVHYPVAAGERLNIVATAEGPWEGNGWSTAAEPSEVTACFPGCCPLLASILSAPTAWMKWAGVTRKPARRWSKGRVTLIGDAAHPMLPFLAQGAAMALEDAAVLAAAVSAEPAIANAFARYETQRIPRTGRVVRASGRQALAYHARGPLRLARNAVLKLMGAEVFLSSVAWLYDWQPPRD